MKINCAMYKYHTVHSFTPIACNRIDNWVYTICMLNEGFHNVLTSHLREHMKPYFLSLSEFSGGKYLSFKLTSLLRIKSASSQADFITNGLCGAGIFPFLRSKKSLKIGDRINPNAWNAVDNNLNRSFAMFISEKDIEWAINKENYTVYKIETSTVHGW